MGGDDRSDEAVWYTAPMSKNLRCGNCGTILTGRQRLWCSAACTNDAWERDNAEKRRAALRRYDEATKLSPADRLRLRITRTEAVLDGLRAELAALEGAD
jgi:hypothetical protein